MQCTSLLLPFLLTGCFGGGPTPTPPAGASIAFATPLPPPDSTCNNSVYNGPIVFDASQGYVMTLAYQPEGNCGGGGGGGPNQPVNVTVFPLDGSNPLGSPLPMGGAGDYNSGQTRPAMTSDGTTVKWLYINGPDLTLGPDTTKLMTSGGMTFGGQSILATAVDSANVYVLGAAASMGQLTDPYNPSYPNFGGGGNSGGLLALLGKIAVPVPQNTSVTITPMATPTINCGELDRCMVANATTLYVMAQDPSMGQLSQLEAFPKTGGAPTTLGVLAPTPQVENPVPVGLDADNQHVAWAMANSATMTPINPGCEIFVSDGTTSMGVFASKKFSCLDVAVAGDWVYFTAIGSSQCNNCGGNSSLLGLGIGRVQISNPSNFNTIGFGFTGVGQGPRRVHVVGDFVYAIDPLAVVRIPTSAFDGQNDVL
jgi:hypothetical protein